MVWKNCCSKSAKLSERQIRAIVKCFAADLPAVQTAQLGTLNRTTVNRVDKVLRKRIVAVCEARRTLFGVVKVDKCYLGPTG